MGRTGVEHQQLPHTEWRRLLLAAWERLGEVKGARGIKSEILESAGIGRTTVSRMSLTPELVSFDSWEDLRIALLDAYKSDERLAGEPVPDLPRPFVQVRSLPHFEIAERIGKAAEAGDVSDLSGWLEVGERLQRLGTLSELTEALKEKADREEALAASEGRLKKVLDTAPRTGPVAHADPHLQARANLEMARLEREFLGFNPDDEDDIPPAEVAPPARKKAAAPAKKPRHL